MQASSQYRLPTSACLDGGAFCLCPTTDKGLGLPCFESSEEQATQQLFLEQVCLWDLPDNTAAKAMLSASQPQRGVWGREGAGHQALIPGAQCLKMSLRVATALIGFGGYLTFEDDLLPRACFTPV